MASNIIYITIDENFPVAGIDNPSEGFRSNFSIIKQALATAKSEITTIQSNTIPSSLLQLGIIDGTVGQVLSTNSNGTFSFVTPTTNALLVKYMPAGPGAVETDVQSKLREIEAWIAAHTP